MVITSLIYPALALRLTSKSLPHVSAEWLHTILGNFASPSSTSTTELVDDLSDIWRGFDNLVVNSDVLLRARCSQGPIVRMERLAINRRARSEYGALEKDTLLDGMKIQKQINEVLAESNNPLLSCLKDSSGNCLVLSPLSFWDSEENLSSTSTDILDTIHRPHGVSTGIHLTPSMVLSHRSFPNSAGYLVLTYFFHDEDCKSNQRHNEWLQLIDRLRSPSLDVRHGTEEPTLRALEASLSSHSYLPLLTTFSVRSRPRRHILPPNSMSLHRIHSILHLLLWFSSEDGFCTFSLGSSIHRSG